MKGMFKDAKSFNQPLYKWNVHYQVNTIDMFTGCLKFLTSYKKDVYKPYRLEEWDIKKTAVIEPTPVASGGKTKKKKGTRKKRKTSCKKTSKTKA
jgi:hypothetical protein